MSNMWPLDAVGVFVGSQGLASAPGLAWAEGLWREDVRVPGKTNHRPTVRTQRKGVLNQVASIHVLPNLLVKAYIPSERFFQQSVFV